MNIEILKNKNIFLTGATGGIGKEFAKQLASIGSNLFLTSKTREKLDILKEELTTINKDIKIAYTAKDFNYIENIISAIDYAKQKFNCIDILINCAGIFLNKPIVECHISEFEKVFNINTKTPWILSKEFIPEMIKSNWGRIINIGSTSSYIGQPNQTIYSASKHALIGMSRALYREMKNHNVRVICVSPSGTKTKMGQQCVGLQDYTTFLNPEEVAEYVINIMCLDNEMIEEEIRLNRYKD